MMNKLCKNCPTLPKCEGSNIEDCERVDKQPTEAQGEVCDECWGAGTKFVGVLDCKGRFERPCPTCNGTGQKPIVTKELREIIKEALK